MNTCSQSMCRSGASATFWKSNAARLSRSVPARVKQLRERKRMRIAATADIHFSPQSYDHVREPMAKVREEADVLIIAGDLTNYGRPEEMRSVLNALVRLRLPIVAVLGNHDYESGHEHELAKMLSDEGIKVLDGSSYERDGVGFAGTKGFPGG